MKSKSILLILSMFLVVQVNSQTRKPQRLKANNIIKFEFMEGTQKLKIPNTKSVLTLQVKGKNFKIVSINRTTNRKTYKLVKALSESCSKVRNCYIGCWKDPITKQYIRIGKNCNKLADGDEINGQLEFLSPDL
jgi:hypothetical protein